MARNYVYVYEVRTDNLCWGGMLLETCTTLDDAECAKCRYERKYGCCCIRKKRKYIAR